MKEVTDIIKDVTGREVSPEEVSEALNGFESPVKKQSAIARRFLLGLEPDTKREVLRRIRIDGVFGHKVVLPATAKSL